MSNAERKARIDELTRQIAELEWKRYAFKKECPHEVIQEPLYLDSALCGICGVDFGWYCPTSPDRLCHYETNGGKVLLLDGRRVKAPPGAQNRMSTEWCMYCKDPEERK